MKIFISSAEGFLGRVFTKAGYKSLGCDVTDLVSIERSINRNSPGLVIHFPGHDDPDWVEKHSIPSNKVNVIGTFNLSTVCNVFKIPFVFISSSHVWGGGWQELRNRHAEDSRMTPAVNLFGMQMTGTEGIVLSFNTEDCNQFKVIRTSYIFNKRRLHDELKKLEAGEPIDPPSFLSRSFIHSDHFLNLMEGYCIQYFSMPNVLHLAGSKRVSYSALWTAIASKFGYDKSLIQSRGMEKSFPARRPYNSGLDVSLSRKLRFPSYDYLDGVERMKSES